MNKADIANWVVTVIAVVISTLALVLNKCQYDQTIKHNKIQLQPKLELNSSFQPNKKSNGIFLRNTGIGPAIIKETKIVFDNEYMPDWDFMRHNIRFAGLGNHFDVTATIIEGETYIEEGRVIELYTAETYNIIHRPSFIEFFRNRVGIQIQYCSLYSECRTECISYPPDTCLVD